MRTTAMLRLSAILFMLVTSMTAGCATVGDQRVDVLYHTTANARGGSGNLYFVEGSVPASSGSTPIQWVLGAITSKDGESLGNIVTDIAPMDLIADAFSQEFKAAGYNIVQENSMPEVVNKGLKLKSATIKLDEVKGGFSVDAKCSVKISVEPWRNGKAMNNLEYEAVYTDSDVRNRDELPSNVMVKALQAIMTRSIPELIKMLEER